MKKRTATGRLLARPVAAAFLMAAVVAAGAVPGAASAQEIVGSDAAACRPGAEGPAALVRVYGFKDRVGNVRAQVYSDNPEEFLVSGKKVRRVDVPTSPAGDMAICVALPRYGEFALVVLHDRDADGKLGVSKDGFGFSNNPKLGLSKPDHDRVAFVAGQGVTMVDVVLNYRKGLLSVGPLVQVRE